MSVCHYPHFIGTNHCCIHIDHDNNYIDHIRIESCPRGLDRLTLKSNTPYPDEVQAVIRRVIGDCIFDEYIIKGCERTIIPQEKLDVKFPFIFKCSNSPPLKEPVLQFAFSPEL